MPSEYITRQEIGQLLGLGKKGVATLVAAEGFPEGLWTNARVVRYPRADVESYLLHLGSVRRVVRRTTVTPISDAAPRAFAVIYA